MAATREQLHRAGLKALDFLVEAYNVPCRDGQQVQDGLGRLGWFSAVTEDGIEVRSAEAPDFEQVKVYPWKTV